MDTMTMKEGMEIQKGISESDKEFDPDSRIDIFESEMDKTNNKNIDSYDPDKRIDGERESQIGTDADKAMNSEILDDGTYESAINEGKSSIENKSVLEIVPQNGENEGLTEEIKEKIKETTGWSHEIIDAIGSKKEAEIYMKAGLREAEIGGKKCLVRNDIDWGQKDEMGRTNKERAEQGLSPISKDGQTVELHHIGQHANSPLAELTSEEHRGKGNDLILHDKAKESEINRTAFARERSNHWEARSQVGGNL